MIDDGCEIREGFAKKAKKITGKSLHDKVILNHLLCILFKADQDYKHKRFK